MTESTDLLDVSGKIAKNIINNIYVFQLETHINITEFYTEQNILLHIFLFIKLKQYIFIGNFKKYLLD